jgi:mRNA interferase RelE/StbE
MWTILVSPTFLNDLSSLPAKTQRRVEQFVFGALPAMTDPGRVGRLEKLKGSRDFYKVRFGDYRVGLRLDGRQRQVHVLRVLHRRDIYRHFP